MIYNAGIRRPPHTGAGLLALRAEFYRDKLGISSRRDMPKGKRRYMEYFDIATRERPLSARRWKPHRSVNITYYPIRARNNIVNRLAHLFVEKLPTA